MKEFKNDTVPLLKQEIYHLQEIYSNIIYFNNLDDDEDSFIKLYCAFRIFDILYKFRDDDITKIKDSTLERVLGNLDVDSFRSSIKSVRNNILYRDGSLSNKVKELIFIIEQGLVGTNVIKTDKEYKVKEGLEKELFSNQFNLINRWIDFSNQLMQEGQLSFYGGVSVDYDLISYIQEKINKNKTFLIERIKASDDLNLEDIIVAFEDFKYYRNRITHDKAHFLIQEKFQKKLSKIIDIINILKKNQFFKKIND